MKKSVFIPTGKKGFTLVEVIISIGFLCIISGIIIQLFIFSGDLRAKTALKEVAAIKAANAVEACKISKHPGEVGKGIFNQDNTSYEKTEDGYIVYEYFDKEWQPPLHGVVPKFVVKTEIMEEQKNITPREFGREGGSSSQIISGLYSIIVTTSYYDEDIEEGLLAKYETYNHYIFEENSGK